MNSLFILRRYTIQKKFKYNERPEIKSNHSSVARGSFYLGCSRDIARRDRIVRDLQLIQNESSDIFSTFLTWYRILSSIKNCK